MPFHSSPPPSDTHPLYDLFAPFMSAAILVKDPPTRVPLAYAEGALSSTTLAVAQLTTTDILPYLSSLTVELQLAFFPKITATLTPPYKEAIDLLNSPIMEYGVNGLEVQFGYATGPGGSVLSPRLYGLLYQPDITIGTDVSITLHAQGIGGFAGEQSSNIPTTLRPRAQIVEDLALGPGGVSKLEAAILGIEAKPRPPRLFNVNFDAVRPGTDAFRYWFKEPVSVTQGGMSDWFMIWKLVREGNCWMQEVNGTCFIFPVSTAFAQKPYITLKVYDQESSPSGQFGPAVGTYPILSVSSPTKAMFIGGMRGLILRGIDPSTRKFVTKIVNDDSARLSRTGLVNSKGDAPAEPAENEATPGADPSTGSGFEFFPVDPSTGESQAKSEFQNIANTMGIHLDIVTVGIPDIIPSQTVAVKGLGIRFDGDNYCVHTVTHELSPSGYTTKLHLVSNTQALLSAYKSSLGPVNTQQPDAGDSDTTMRHPEADGPEADSPEAKHGSAALEDSIDLRGIIGKALIKSNGK